MSRHHSDFLFSYGVDQRLLQEIHAYLSDEGYSFREFRGELVYKKGNGIATGPTFVKVMVNGNYLTIEAWIMFAALPGVYAGEMGITGSAGAIPKAAVRSRVRVIEEMAQQWGGVLAFTGEVKEGVPQSGVNTVPFSAPPSAAPSGACAYCASCGNALRSFAAFCEACGAPVGQKNPVCPTCGQNVTEEQVFCSSCGTKLK